MSAHAALPCGGNAARWFAASSRCGFFSHDIQAFANCGHAHSNHPDSGEAMGAHFERPLSCSLATTLSRDRHSRGSCGGKPWGESPDCARQVSSEPFPCRCDAAGGGGTLQEI